MLPEGLASSSALYLVVKAARPRVKNAGFCPVIAVRTVHFHLGLIWLHVIVVAIRPRVYNTSGLHKIRSGNCIPLSGLT